MESFSSGPLAEDGSWDAIFNWGWNISSSDARFKTRSLVSRRASNVAEQELDVLRHVGQRGVQPAIRNRNARIEVERRFSQRSRPKG